MMFVSIVKTYPFFEQRASPKQLAGTTILYKCSLGHFDIYHTIANLSRLKCVMSITSVTANDMQV